MTKTNKQKNLNSEHSQTVVSIGHGPSDRAVVLHSTHIHLNLQYQHLRLLIFFKKKKYINQKC